MNRLGLALALVAACKSPRTSDIAAPAGSPHATPSKGPSIVVETSWPGASATDMAAAVSVPLERLFGQMPELAQMTSRSRRGHTTIRVEMSARATLDEAARDVQAAINAASAFLPKSLPAPPIYMKVGRDPAVMRVTLASETLPLDVVGTQADEILAQMLSQVAGVGLVSVCGFAAPEWHVIVDPQSLAAMGKTVDEVVAEVREPQLPEIGSALNPGAFSTFSIDKLPLARMVAKLERGTSPPDCVAYDAGHPVVAVTVRAQPGADRAETRAMLDALLPEIGKQLAPGIVVRVSTAETTDDDELTAGSDTSHGQRIEDARVVAQASGALVELGIDRDGDPSPETVVVHGAKGALDRIARDRQLVLHDRDEHVVGFESADPAALADALARHVAALSAANVPVRGTLGAGETSQPKLEVDRDTMARLGIADDSALATVLQAMQPEGIVAGTVFTQLSMQQIVVTVPEPELAHLYARASGGTLVPLDAFVKVTSAPEPAEVLHQGQFPWVGIRVGGTRDALDAALAHIPVAQSVQRSVAE
jgi:multidrug efflux pump subunit AcrB